jgi:hypothetical protein
MRDGPELMDELPESLREATRLLRETPQSSPAWRDRVLREVSGQERPMVQEVSRSATRWSFRPASAIAAGVLCAVLGGATVAAVLGGSPEKPAQVGVTQSPATSEAPVRFKFIAPGAARVSVAGDFNAWNPTVLPLRRSADGRTWEVVVQLAPGRYAYAFVVDGKITPDPEAPQATDDDFGTPSSVVLVSGS